MKRLKITSVLLSVVMCVSMAFPSIGVIADEAAEPTETQTEATEKKQEPKATEKKQTAKAPEKKQEPKETEKKEEPKETVKQEPKETEKKEEPKETAKQEPKETEKKEEPTEPEKQDPTESKNEEPTEPEKQDPTEPEKEEPTEPEKQEPTESKEEEPTESKREEPTEPEKQETTESENEAPSETETQAPEETEPEKEPEATEVPGGKVTKAPKNSVSFSNVNLNQSTGIMTWDAVPGANCYLIVIDNYDGGYEIWLDALNGGSEIDPWYEENCWEVEKDERSVDLHKVIRSLIKSDYLEKADNNKYYVYILAFSDGYDYDQYLEGYAGMCTPYKTTLVYETNSKPVVPDEITGVSFSNGKMTWNKLSDPNAVYNIEVGNEEGSVCSPEDTNSFEINKTIDESIRERNLFKLGNKYTVKIYVVDEDYVTIASWEGTYTYDSKATPKTLPGVKAVLSGDNLNWNGFSGADHYDIRIIGSNIRWYYDCFELSWNLKDEIRTLINESELKEVCVYTIELYAADDSGNYIGMWKGTYTYKQMPNTLNVSGKTATIKKKKVKRKNKTLKVGKVINFKNKGQGTLSYSKISGNKKIKINSKNGNVTVKKKIKKGKYKVWVWVKASGNAQYTQAKKKVKFTIRIK